MTTNELISHLTALVAADPTVGELPTYTLDGEYGVGAVHPAVMAADSARYEDQCQDRHVRLNGA